jgi:hypothetical protein
MTVLLSFSDVKYSEPVDYLICWILSLSCAHLFCNIVVATIQCIGRRTSFFGVSLIAVFEIVLQ